MTPQHEQASHQCLTFVARCAVCDREAQEELGTLRTAVEQLTTEVLKADRDRTAEMERRIAAEAKVAELTQRLESWVDVNSAAGDALQASEAARIAAEAERDIARGARDFQQGRAMAAEAALRSIIEQRDGLVQQWRDSSAECLRLNGGEMSAGIDAQQRCADQLAVLGGGDRRAE